jgi:type II secretory pathway component PulJ
MRALNPPRPGSRQRGLSLVELMVGITVGLFVVAAAATLAATQLADNRRLLVETQVQQDLRASMDIITRQLRRAGALSQPQALLGLATPTADGQWNAYAPVTLAGSAGRDEIGFRYVVNAAESGPFGFKLQGGVVKTLMGAGGWQDLSDPNTLVVTNLSITAGSAGSIALPCARLCSDGGTACWPTVEVRHYLVEITGHARSDTAVQRTLRSDVRLRNDWVRFNDAAHPTQACPA